MLIIDNKLRIKPLGAKFKPVTSFARFKPFLSFSSFVRVLYPLINTSSRRYIHWLRLINFYSTDSTQVFSNTGHFTPIDTCILN